MFDYLVQVELDKGMLSYIMPASKLAKLCAAYTVDGIGIDCIRAYKLMRNSDPELMHLVFEAKYNWLDIYNKHGVLIEGGVRVDNQACG